MGKAFHGAAVITLDAKGRIDADRDLGLALSAAGEELRGPAGARLCELAVVRLESGLPARPDDLVQHLHAGIFEVGEGTPIRLGRGDPGDAEAPPFDPRDRHGASRLAMTVAVQANCGVR